MNVTELHELVVRTVEPDDLKILREILPHVNAEDYLNLLYAAKINGWRIHFEFKFDSRKEQPVNDKTFYKVSISMAFRPNHPEADSEVEIATIEPEIALPYKPHLLPSRQESKGQLLRELKKKEGLKLIFAEKFDQLITQNQALNSAIYQGITDEKIPKNSKQSLETLGPKLSLAQRLHRACEMAIARRITRSRVALDRSNVDLD